MVKLKIKGHEFEVVSVKDSFNRRAVQFGNNIISTLRKLGISEHSIDVPIETFAVKKANASASWYFEGYHLYYSFNSLNNFAENLGMVFKVIEYEVNKLLNDEKTAEEFIREFSEDNDIVKKRKEAREVLGVSYDTLDFDVVNAKYKALAKEHHPDMPNGNAEKFKEINNAHKLLKRELQ